MADMVEVVIKMPKEKYDSICNMYETFPAEMKEWGLEYIKNGTVVEADTQNKENKEKEDITPYTTGVTLLSVEEAKNLNKEILKADNEWWLRSPGVYDDTAAFVYGFDGTIHDLGRNVRNSFGVRPALEISKSSGYKIGESVDFGGHSFTIISDTYALCDDVMGECPFRHDSKAENAYEYEASDIKRYLEYWFEMIKEQNLEEEREI